MRKVFNGRWNNYVLLKVQNWFNCVRILGPAKFVFFVLLAVGLWLRITKLETYPGQIQQDELSNIYDAYSISETGKDRWGTFAPVILRAFGENDYRPPMYCWLAAGSIKYFGNTVFAGRLPSVLLGAASLFLLFLTARRVWGVEFSLVALTSLVFSPWHVMMSRLALEAAILPSFFLILVFYLFLLAKENNYLRKDTLFLGLSVGLASNAYQSTKLVFFIISIYLIWDIFRAASASKKTVIGFIAAVALGASPQLYAALVFSDYFFARAGATLMHPEFSINYILRVIMNYYSNLNPEFLFLHFGQYNNLTIARLLPAEMFFFYLGLITFGWQSRRIKWIKPKVVYFLFLLCILPSALTYDNPHALRTSTTVVLFPLFTASGVITVCNLIKISGLRHFSSLLPCFFIIINFTFYLIIYTSDRDLINAGHQPLLAAAAKKIHNYQHNFENIYIEDIGNQPYIYILNYCKVNPIKFRAMEKIVYTDGWDHFSKMGKYNFLTEENIKLEIAKNLVPSLIVVRRKEFPLSIMDSVKVGSEKLYFYSN